MVWQGGIKVKELEYPFDSEYIRKKQIKIRKALLADETVKYIDKRIAVLGGSTTSDVKDMIELFLLNNGIKASFYESEYNKFYEDAVFDNKELEEFKPDIIYVCTSNRNISRYPAIADDEKTVAELLDGEFKKLKNVWQNLGTASRATQIYSPK